MDHPRVCGEKDSWHYADYYTKGSPPRVRGKVFYSFLLPSSSGITPACAGKRIQISAASPARWDHPRVCGEKHTPIT